MRPQEPLADDAGVPPELRLGPVYECWTRPGDPDAQVHAATAHRDAKVTWLTDHGIGWGDRDKWPPSLQSAPAGPRSFYALGRRDPAALVGRLAAVGVPPMWQPTLVPRPAHRLPTAARRVQRPETGTTPV